MIGDEEMGVGGGTSLKGSRQRHPGLLVSLIPVLFLMAGLVVNILVFGDDATSGANQMALLLAAVLTLAIGVMGYKQGYQALEGHVLRSVQVAMQANLILLTIGALIGIWILCGIVPTMIYYGLKLIHPSVFLPVCCITCAVVSLSTGSSWSTTGTVGIALMGVGKTLGIPDGMVAGAIISGAYFGDKMSPLSDTTNLAPAMAGTDLFTHIRHMMTTTVPAMVLSTIAFLGLGLFYAGAQGQPETIAQVALAIKDTFFVSPLLLGVPAMVVVMVVKKVPALPAIVAATLVAALLVPLVQQPLLLRLAGGEAGAGVAYRHLLTTAFDGFQLESGHELLDSLFNRGGMKGMLTTVWLILMAMVFGGAMEGTGMLASLASSVMRLVHGAGSLIGATLASAVLVNLTACDQYLSIVVPGRMFKSAYEEMKLHPKNLSRALEDGGTITSVLIPWNTCGAYTSGVLGVPVLTYLPFCFFNLINPLLAGVYAGLGITIQYQDQGKEQGQEPPAQVGEVPAKPALHG